MSTPPIRGAASADAQPAGSSDIPAPPAAQSPSGAASERLAVPERLKGLPTRRSPDDPVRREAAFALSSLQKSLPPAEPPATPPERTQTLANINLPLNQVLASPQLVQQAMKATGFGSKPVRGADGHSTVTYSRQRNAINIHVGTDIRSVTIQLDATHQHAVSISADPFLLSREMLDYLVQAQLLHPSILELDTYETRPDLLNKLSADGTKLDLTHVFLVSLENVPPEITDATRSNFTELVLPATLSSIPAWIESLPNLRRLEAPNYFGANLTVRNPSLEALYTNGVALRTVEVPATAEVYCRGPSSFDQEKIEVTYRDTTTGEVVRTGPAIGHLYYTSDPNSRIDYRAYLNGQANFPRTQIEIVCRHLSMDWVHRLQQHRARRDVRRFVDEWAAGHADRGMIASSVSPHTDDRLVEAHVHGPEQALLGHQQWGTFFRDEFSRMRPGAMKQFIVSTATHVMGIELAVTRGAHGERYIATYYDPNMTLNRARIMEDSLNDVEQWSGDTFMERYKAEGHYGGRSQPEVALFISVPTEFHSKFMSQPLFDAPPTDRTLRNYLAPEDRSNSAVSAILYYSDHVTSDALGSMLAGCRTPAEKIAVLAGERLDGRWSIRFATLSNRPRSVSAFCEVVRQARLAGELTHEQVSELMSPGPDDPLPMFHRAMQFRDAKMARSYIDMFERMLMGDVWPAQQKMGMLKAVASNGDTALYGAFVARNVEAVRLFGQMLVRLLAAGRLTQEEFLELLSCGSQDGCAVRRAVEAQDEEMLLALGEIIGQGAATGRLSNDKVFELIAGNGAIEPSIFAATTRRWPMEAIRPFCTVLKNMWSTGALTSEQVFDILGGERAGDPPPFFTALQEAISEATFAIGDGIGDLYDAGALTRDQVETLLEAKADNGKIGVVNAHDHGNDEAVQAFWAVVDDAVAAGQVSAAKALEWAEASST